MSDAFTIYGIAVIPKTGGEPVDEWFPSRKQRDEFLAWYKSHDRKCAAISRPDQAAIDRASHQRALEVARAGRSSFHHVDRRSYSSFGSGAAVGLLLGVGAGLF